MSKRILITGATGFVGRQIFKALQKNEVSIVPVVRAGKEPLIEDRSKVEKIISTPDLFAESETWWTEQCQNIDLVIHAAWYAEPGEYLNSLINIDCLVGSLKMAKGAALAGIHRYVGIGTCHEYDLSDGNLTEDTPLKPLTPYASAKASLYIALSKWFSVQAIQFAWCRLFYLYGEGEDGRRLMPYIRRQLENGVAAKLTRGDQIRDFMNVAEVGKIVAKIGIGCQQGVINICSGKPITVRQFAEKIAAEYQRFDLLQFGAREVHCVDPPLITGKPNY